MKEIETGDIVIGWNNSVTGKVINDLDDEYFRLLVLRAKSNVGQKLSFWKKAFKKLDIPNKVLVKCPAHKEETPSCVFDLRKKTFECLSCGANGKIYIIKCKNGDTLVHL